MPDKFDFEKPRRYKLNFRDDVRKIPFEITCIMANISTAISLVIGDILRQAIFRGDKEIYLIANDITSSIAYIAIAGIIAGVLTRDDFKW